MLRSGLGYVSAKYLGGLGSKTSDPCKDWIWTSKLLKCLSAWGNFILKLLRDEANFEMRATGGKRRHFGV